MDHNMTNPDYRSELVEKFRLLIETGLYPVSNQAIAQAMMDKGVFEFFSRA